MKRIAAGIIINDGQILVCQRKKGSYYELKWEFPGGKAELNETIGDCLVRELREELNIEIKIDSLFHIQKHKYPDGFEFEIHFFIILDYSDDLRNNVFEKIEWAGMSDLERYDFLEADKDILQMLKNRYLQTK